MRDQATPRKVGGPGHWRGRGVASPSVINTVVEGLAAPQGIRVVKFEEVDTSAGIRVGASVHLLIAVPAVHRNDD